MDSDIEMHPLENPPPTYKHPTETTAREVEGERPPPVEEELPPRVEEEEQLPTYTDVQIANDQLVEAQREADAQQVMAKRKRRKRRQIICCSLCVVLILIPAVVLAAVFGSIFSHINYGD